MAKGTCEVVHPVTGEVCGPTDRLLLGKWCNKHYFRNRVHGDPNISLTEWPWTLTEFLTEQPNGCIWHANKPNRDGYGPFYRDGVNTLVHRAAYEWFIGPIPAGYQVDHLCHDPDTCQVGSECPHRRCCNPSHLGIVTPRENVLRSYGVASVNASKTHCIRGHEYTNENTRWYTTSRGGPYRACRECDRARWTADNRRRAMKNRER